MHFDAFFALIHVVPRKGKCENVIVMTLESANLDLFCIAYSTRVIAFVVGKPRDFRSCFPSGISHVFFCIISHLLFPQPVNPKGQRRDYIYSTTCHVAKSFLWKEGKSFGSWSKPSAFHRLYSVNSNYILALPYLYSTSRIWWWFEICQKCKNCSRKEKKNHQETVSLFSWMYIFQINY